MSVESNTRQNVLTIIQDGGATYEQVADLLGIQKTTARDHVSDLRNKDGVSLNWRKVNGAKQFYARGSEHEHPINPDVPTQELQSKAALTKNAKETVHELIQKFDKDLTGRAPAVSDGGLDSNSGHEDMVCHRSDDHIGASYHDEFGNNTFSAEVGIDRVRTVTEKVFRLKRRQEQAGVDFDTFHLLLGGDHVHGIGIHDDQPWETDLSLPEQLDVASDLYMEFIDRAVREFDSVQVVCQVGNHGELRGDGMGPDDNVDTAFFMSLDRRVRDRDYDNIQFVRSEAGNFTNFRMREDREADEEKAEKLGVPRHDLPEELRSGHRGHLRHGQDSLEHIGTSAGKKRWLVWKDQHEFDIAYRGHYHTFQMDSILDARVIESGSIVPPDDFEDSLAEWSEPAATVHGVSSERTVTWLYPVDFVTPADEVAE